MRRSPPGAQPHLVSLRVPSFISAHASHIGSPRSYAQHLWHHLTEAQLAAVDGPDWFRARPHTLYARMVLGLAASGACPRLHAVLAMPDEGDADAI